MSAVTIRIDIPPESQALIKRFDEMPAELTKAIQRGMGRALDATARRIQETRLAGKGPFPPAQHRLGEVSTQLRGSVRVTPPVVRGKIVEGAIGTPVIYGRVHEFGFQGAVRYRTKTGKTATRQMNIPERAPFRTGIDENKDFIAGEIAKEIEDTFKKS